MPSGNLGLEQFCVEQMDDHTSHYGDEDGGRYLEDEDGSGYPDDDDDYDDGDYYDDQNDPEDPKNLYSQGEHNYEHAEVPTQPRGCSTANKNEDFDDHADYAGSDDTYTCHDEANNYRSKPHEMIAFMCYRQTCRTDPVRSEKILRSSYLQIIF